MNRNVWLLSTMIIGQGLSGAGYASPTLDTPYHAESSFDTASEIAANDTSPLDTSSDTVTNDTSSKENPPEKPLPRYSTPYKSRTSAQEARYTPPPRKKSSNYLRASYTPPPRDENAPASYAPQPRPNPNPTPTPIRKRPSNYVPASDTSPHDNSDYSPASYSPPPRDDSAPASYAPQPHSNSSHDTPSYYTPASDTHPRYTSARAYPPHDTCSYEASPHEENLNYSPAYSSETSSHETVEHERHSHNNFQFYLGMVGGIERMNGRRTEGVSEVFGGNPVQTSYTSSYRMLENNATLSFLGGFLWKFPPLPIFMGPEFYFGRGNARSTISDVRADPGGANNRLYTTDFQRKFFYGGLIRVGYQFCRDYLISLSFGIDRSQFLTRRIIFLDPVNAPPTFITRTKAFNGFLYGVGFERAFKNIIVGIDLKLIQYRRQLTEDPVIISTGPASSNFTVRPVIYIAGLRLCYRF